MESSCSILFHLRSRPLIPAAITGEACRHAKLSASSSRKAGIRHKRDWGSSMKLQPPCVRMTAAVSTEGGSDSPRKVEITVDSSMAPLRTTALVGESEDAERIGTLVREIKDIFQSMNDGEISPSAYDTAWVARIPSRNDPSKPQFPTMLDWILKNQQEDGSWGDPIIFLIYDRLICTLACIITLKKWRRGEEHIAKGLQFLWNLIEYLEKESMSLMPCGFEIIFPSMLGEACSLGLHLPYDSPCLKNIILLREKKISRIPLEAMNAVLTTLLYSLEALQEVVQWERVLKWQSRCGGFLGSPSATAAAYMKTGDAKCLEYLTNIVRKYGDHTPTQYPIDHVERLWAVDTIQRLGISHHFRKEISDVLDYVYRNINIQGLSWGAAHLITDIDDTSMALRLLRLHGYPVSPDSLEYFRDDDGSFVCFPGETHRGVSDMFNLYRLSQISYPGERILKEAEAFTKEHLRRCTENNKVDDKWSLKKALAREVDHALRYPWNMSLQRLESRDYINNYGDDDAWIAKTIYRLYNVNNSKYLELAKLDYNRLLRTYKGEISTILKWWNNCGFNDTFVTKQVSPEEIHFSIAATLYEPEFSACRMAYTKCNCTENILKDLFENHESVVDLRLACQAVEQWNPSLAQHLPLVVKVVFMRVYDTLNELAIQARNARGKDSFPYLHDLVSCSSYMALVTEKISMMRYILIAFTFGVCHQRLKTIQAYLTNREKRGGEFFMSTLKECIDHGKSDAGVAIRVVPAMLLMGEHLQDHVLRCLDHRSWFHDQLSLFLKLLTDVRTYKDAMDKETTCAVSCYMKEENCREEEALNHLKGLMQDTFDELKHEYLKPSRVPLCCRRLMFEHGRIALFFLNEGIDFDTTRNEMVTDAMEFFFTPV